MLPYLKKGRQLFWGKSASGWPGAATVPRKNCPKPEIQIMPLTGPLGTRLQDVSSPLPLRESGTCYHRRSRHYHHIASGPEVLFKTCVAMKFVDDDDDGGENQSENFRYHWKLQRPIDPPAISRVSDAAGGRWPVGRCSGGSVESVRVNWRDGWLWGEGGGRAMSTLEHNYVIVDGEGNAAARMETEATMFSWPKYTDKSSFTNFAS